MDVYKQNHDIFSIQALTLFRFYNATLYSFL